VSAPLRYSALFLLAVGTAACGSSHGHQAAAPASTRTVPSTTAPVAPSTSPTTAAWRPASPQSSAAAAAALLVSDWAGANRAAAAAIAPPAAVSALFAAPYPGPADALSRGCGQTDPEVCTYGPNGGAPSSLPIYNIAVVQGAGGWWVSTVEVES
jgi:hypothetical protein